MKFFKYDDGLHTKWINVKQIYSLSIVGVIGSDNLIDYCVAVETVRNDSFTLATFTDEKAAADYLTDLRVKLETLDDDRTAELITKLIEEDSK